MGMQVILPGMMNWRPLGSDLFSRTLNYKVPNGEVGYLKPPRDLFVNLTVKMSMLAVIHEHEHHLNLRVSYDANIWEERRIIKLVDTFTDIFTTILFPRDLSVAELLLGGAEGTTRFKAHL